jgi:hypothetical protein
MQGLVKASVNVWVREEAGNAMSCLLKELWAPLGSSVSYVRIFSSGNHVSCNELLLNSFSIRAGNVLYGM